VMFGLGLGACMQTLIVAVQNAVPARDMGVATASATFFRQLGGTLGVAVFLSILFSTVGDKIADAFRVIAPTAPFQAALADPAVRADPANQVVIQAVQSGSTGGTGGAGGVLQDSSFLQVIDPRLARPFLVGFSDSMQLVFLVAACVISLAWFAVLAMRELPLRTQSGIQARESEAGRGAAESGDPETRQLVVSALVLAWLADHIERVDGNSPQLTAAAATLAPLGGTTDHDRAATAARTVLRPLARLALLRVTGPPPAERNGTADLVGTAAAPPNTTTPAVREGTR
jgi:hypothetical protein